MTTSCSSATSLQRYAVAAAGLSFISGVSAAPTASPNAPAEVTAVNDGDSNTLQFDIDGNGVADFEFFVSATDSCTGYPDSPGNASISYEGDSLTDTGIAFDTTDSSYAALVSGSFPGGSESFDSFSGFLGCDSGSNSPTFLFNNSTTTNRDFIGVGFARDGQTHYGVIELEFVAGSVTANIVRACYESTPGEPIDTADCVRITGGAPTAVPTGNVAIPLSLGLLALGGVALYRRQRAHA